jgi:hypothetical protein
MSRRAGMICMLMALAAAAPLSARDLGGLYRSETMEVGAALLLKPDGQFRYQLDYGAVSESADGSWTEHPGIVLLTSTRMEGNWEGPFAGERLAIEGDTLILRRYDREIKFVRATTQAMGEEE